MCTFAYGENGWLGILSCTNCSLSVQFHALMFRINHTKKNIKHIQYTSLYSTIHRTVREKMHFFSPLDYTQWLKTLFIRSAKINSVKQQMCGILMRRGAKRFCFFTAWMKQKLISNRKECFTFHFIYYLLNATHCTKSLKSN